MHEQPLTSLEAFREALDRHPAVLLFKHSPICPISDAARERWRAWCATHPDVPTVWVDVIADKPVARGLADACGVVHASPQAIAFREGRPVWDRSHDAITADSLDEGWSLASGAA